MRFTKVTLCTLTVAAAAALPAQATTTATPPALATPPLSKDVVIPTEAPAGIPTQSTIAPPESIAVQPQFSLPSPPLAAEKYSPIDRYHTQVMEAKAAQELAQTTSQTSSPAASPTISQAGVNPVIKPTVQPVSKSAIQPIINPANNAETIAVKPIALSIASSVAQPSIKQVVEPAAANTKPAAKSVPNGSTKIPDSLPDTTPTNTTSVNIIGVDSELQDVARQVLLTQPNKTTNAVIVRDDVSALLDTGLFTSAGATALMNPKGVDITFNLVPVIAKGIELINAKNLDTATATQILKPQLGKPVQPSLLNQGVRDLQQWYSDRGYSLARVVGMTSQQDGILKVTVAEGEVNNIQIRFIDDMGRSQDDKGNAIKGRTQESLIRQSIKLEKGTAFKESTAQEDLNRLFKTGLFLGGRVTLEGDLRNATVVYNLAEKQLRRTDIGGGYSSDAGLNATVSYRDFNFGGLGQQLGGSVIVGAKDFQFDGRFANPYRESQPNTWGYSVQGFRNRGLSRVFDGDVKLASGNDVREGQFGGAVSFNKPIAPDWSANLGLGYNRVSARDANGDLVQFDSAGKPLSLSGTGLDDLYSVSAGLSYDKRDNILDPKSGSLLSLTTQQYVPIGVGNVLANRLNANYSQYVPVNLFGSSNPKTQDILAFNVQGGTTIGDLPPSQAFVLGGVNSVRGFEQGQVGIGKSYALASAEYRFPILNDTIGGTLFADYGTDLGTSGAVVGAPGVERARSGSGFGYGAGVRVNSPLGLLRADWGFNDRGENRIQFGVGQKF